MPACGTNTLTVTRLEPFVGILYLQPGHIDPLSLLFSFQLWPGNPQLWPVS